MGARLSKRLKRKRQQPTPVIQAPDQQQQEEEEQAEEADDDESRVLSPPRADRRLKTSKSTNFLLSMRPGRKRHQRHKQRPSYPDHHHQYSRHPEEATSSSSHDPLGSGSSLLTPPHSTSTLTTTNSSSLDTLSNALMMAEQHRYDQQKTPASSSFSMSVLGQQEEPNKLLSPPRHDDATERLLQELYGSTDVEREQEQELNQREHYFLKQIWGANYRLPLAHDSNNGPTLICHWMCITGAWGLEMAREFPTAKVVGLYIYYCHGLLPPISELLPNLEFRQAFVSSSRRRRQQHEYGFEGFETDTVDCIRMRQHIWFLNSAAWNRVLAEAFRVLKPGGWIEIYGPGM